MSAAVLVPKNLLRLMQLLLPFRRRIACAFLGMGIIAATEPALVWIVKHIVDAGAAFAPARWFWSLPVALIGLFALRGMAVFGTGFLMASVSNQLLSELQQQAFNRLLHVHRDFYADSSAGKVVNFLAFEARQCLVLVERVVIKFFRSLMTVTGLCAYVFFLDWRYGVLTLLGAVPFVLILRSTGKRYSAATQRFIDVNSQLAGALAEQVRAHQVIKTAGAAEHLADPFSGLVTRLKRETMAMARVVTLQVPLTQLVAALAIAFVFLLHRLVRIDHSTGEFVAVIGNLLLMLAPLRDLAEVNGALQRGLAGTDALFAVVDAPAERALGQVINGRARGQLDVVQVSYQYPGSAEPALRGITLSLHAGEIVAVTGASGSGKSTLAQLIPEILAPTGGEILLDGTPLRKWSLKDLREQIALVSQRPVLRSGTLLDNIAYGAQVPDLERVHRAVRDAHLSTLLATLPMGLQTQLDAAGQGLSGGQLQRIAIARALYRDAPILVLDEPTASLDGESEAHLLLTLQQAMRGKTVLLITHSGALQALADRIVTMQGGRIVASVTPRKTRSPPGFRVNPSNSISG